MLDSLSDNWGVFPYLKIFNLTISSYTFFVVLALLVGALVFFMESRKQVSVNENTFFIAVAALLGGAFGSKVFVWLLYLPELSSSSGLTVFFASGRTIVGGFIGGMIAVFLTKKYLKINNKMGNLFAPAIALGLAVGRIGCFLRGSCYGIPTTLPWGVDFGDGIFRHPTQVYESLFALGMFFYLDYLRKKSPKPGELLKVFLIAYFIFRFFLEFIKFEPAKFLDLTIYQFTAILVLVYLLRDNIKETVKKYVHI